MPGFLAGTPVSDLPAQQPKKFELVINEKVARGLTIPHAVRSRASRVID
jgi:hypothetical protein